MELLLKALETVLAATVLRSNNMNEAVVVALLGHTPNSISMSYGAVPWSELKRAVKLL